MEYTLLIGALILLARIETHTYRTRGAQIPGRELALIRCRRGVLGGLSAAPPDPRADRAGAIGRGTCSAADQPPDTDALQAAPGGHREADHERE